MTIAGIFVLVVLSLAVLSVAAFAIARVLGCDAADAAAVSGQLFGTLVTLLLAVAGVAGAYQLAVRLLS